MVAPYVILLLTTYMRDLNSKARIVNTTHQPSSIIIYFKDFSIDS